MIAEFGEGGRAGGKTGTHLVIRAETLGGDMEQPGEQTRFPAVPAIRPNRGNIRRGQYQQQPQPLHRLHNADEVIERLRVFEVAFQRCL